MTLKEILHLVDQLSPEEKNELVDYLVKTPVQHDELKAGTMDIDALLPVFRAMRTDMGKEAFGEMIEDMNSDYIEPIDESAFDL